MIKTNILTRTSLKMKLIKLIKASVILTAASLMTAQAASNKVDELSTSEIILVHTTYGADPSIPTSPKDKRWERAKDTDDLIKVFHSHGNPNVVFSKKLSLLNGVPYKIKELNGIDLVLKDDNYKNQRELFNANKIEFDIREVGIYEPKKIFASTDKRNVTIDYRIDLLSEFKTDVMNMEVYPTYQTFSDKITHTTERGKYKVLSQMLLKDRSYIFMVYKYEK